MTKFTALITLLLAPLTVALTACDDPQEYVDDAAERGTPLGKADAFGTCEPADCGGKSSTSACYCDEACIDFGDCCENVADACEWEVPAACPAVFIPMPDCELGNPEAIFNGECLVGWECPALPEQCPDVVIPQPECDSGFLPEPLFNGECLVDWQCPVQCPAVFIPPPECESGEPTPTFNGECHSGWECP